MGKRVFVGNIPYDATEETLIEHFREVGPVVAFKIRTDSAGKPRGFGFCEYRDHETALSAIRNLNGLEINGRPLRVDLADSDKNAGPAGAGGGRGAGFRMGDSGSGTSQAVVAVAPAPAGSAGGPNRSPTDLTEEVLRGMSATQLRDAMVQVKDLVDTQPERAREILDGNPQLAYALLQTQLLLGMATEEEVREVLASAPPASMAPPPASGGPSAPPAAASAAPDPMSWSATPKKAPIAPPPPADPQQAALLSQVLRMTPEQIAALPPQQREQVKQLQMAYAKKR
mmetsp:Transcript_19507/g.54856  ORF Transcript_19507/g.54856 Transcript_19507/m.54856 type:complete len:285 (-) Transcript_19507:1486-2340(-)